MEYGPFNTEVSVPTNATGQDWDGIRVINLWRKQWIEGRFPEATPTGEEDIREINCRVEPLEGERTPLNFGFLEVSGELQRSVMPGETRNPNLIRTLRGYLENENLKMVLMLLMSPEVEENDVLFSNFITFLDVNFPGARERMSLGVIISKPEDSLERLKLFGGATTDVSFGAELRGARVEDYVETFAPSTYRIWDQWPSENRKMLASLHLGEIINEGTERRLTAPEFEDISRIFAWLYTQFTGRKLGPRFFERLLRWIKQ